MTSLSSNVANWSSSGFYKFGDTVFWEGQVYILNAVSNSITPYVPGVPPYPSDGIWFNPAGTVVPPPIVPSPLTIRQTAAGWDAENNYGTFTFSWTGGVPNKGFNINYGGSLITTPQSFYIDEDSNTGTIYGVPAPPGTTVNIFLIALSITGPLGNVASNLVPMTSLGPPPAPSISLQTVSPPSYIIDPITGKGTVSINFNLNIPEGGFNDPTDIEGFAIGSTGTDGNPNYTFEYDRNGNIGTATFSNITNYNNISPPLSFKVCIRGSNSVGPGPLSNILEYNFNPTPPLPDNIDNIALVTFLVGGGDYTTGWSINTFGPGGANPKIAPYNCNTGSFEGGNTAGVSTIQYLQALQARGVKVLLSLGGASWSVPTSLTNGTTLAQNIAFAFFGVGSSASGWLRYGATLTPSTPFSFDGLDLDWEGAGTTNGAQEINFLTQFRSLLPGQILSMAPQPPYNANATTFPSAFTANGAYSPFPTAVSPPSAFVPSSSSPALFDVNNLGFFDYIFVQYYNNPDWAPGTQVFQANVAQFAKMCIEAIPHRDSVPNVLGTRFVLGLACADSTTPLYNFERDNPPIQEALQQAQLVNSRPTVRNFCAGAGFWNSPTANYPPPPNTENGESTNPFFQLYNADTGVEALFDTDVIMMYCNANGIDPQWQTLPLLDFEEPGEPDIPPLAYTLANSSTSTPTLNNVVITLTTPPAGLISLQVFFKPAGGALANFRPAVVTNLPNGTYNINIGTQNFWSYDWNVRGLFINGTSLDSFQNGFTLVAVGSNLYTPNWTPGVALPPRSGSVRLRVTLNPASAGGNTPSDERTLIWGYKALTAPVIGTASQPINAIFLPLGAVIPSSTNWSFSAGIWFKDYYFDVGEPDGTTVWTAAGVTQNGVQTTIQGTMVQRIVGQ